jgi:myo-inositol-1(or 4)-monophosphatase
VAESTYPVKGLIQFAMETVEKAGGKALSFYGRGERGIKFDADLVTKAEIHLTRFFESEILKYFPEHQLFHSGQPYNGYTHGEKRYLWVFDPVNGSANFQSGIPIWGMSMALLENSWPVLGVFHMPVTGDMFHAAAGEKAYHGTTEIRMRGREPLNDESLLFAYSRFHQKYRCSFPGKIRELGCTGAHFCYVAMGRADAALASNESFQNLAALRVIVEAVGGKLLRLDGGDFYLNEYLSGQNVQGNILTCSPDLVHQIKGCLQEL